MSENGKGYDCWLDYRPLEDARRAGEYRRWCARIIAATGDSPAMRAAVAEIRLGVRGMLGIEPAVSATPRAKAFILLGRPGESPLLDAAISSEDKKRLGEEGFLLKTASTGGAEFILVAGRTGAGVLRGVFRLLQLMRLQADLTGLHRLENPVNPLRLIDHWDNLDGSIERGYAGRSIFFAGNRIRRDRARIKDYARLLGSLGINGVVLNNVNVREHEAGLIGRHLPAVAGLAEIFRAYGMRVYLSINYASPMLLGGLPTADPLDPAVRRWWRGRAAEIYSRIPDFGGFLVKADSEFTPGPFTYGRDHAEGANMLAEALAPFGGLVLWRCFVYNCTQDWRDRTIDRARAAYDHFKPLDGRFHENVVLQIKNGPIDFQVREPVSPLFGGLERTNQLLELQITQEYTGQQRHLCYLVPQWREVLDFETYARGKGSPVKAVVSGALFGRPHAGFAGVANIGDDPNWTGHDLAQANLYGFGRLAWDPDLPADAIAREWAGLTFGNEPRLVETVTGMLMASWPIYESYTAPLGVGWMVNPGHHYGPNVDGYEYSKWGTYHRADCRGLGVDRTAATGTGYTRQYHAPNAEMYEGPATCPDELLLFFHHVPYTHRLRSGKTVIQHIYDSHFEGVERVAGLIEKWRSLRGLIDDERYERVLARLEEQLEHAREWRDVINTYFYRKSGIADEKGRRIY